MYKLSWVGNTKDRSGKALLTIGTDKVSVNFQDISDFHRLDNMIKQIVAEERRVAHDQLRNRVLFAINTHLNGV